jgi:hypothetical protein
MFSRRHEQELAEIKAMTHDLGLRFDHLMEQLEAVKETQDQLAVRVKGDQPEAKEAPERRKGNRNRGQAAGAKQSKRERAARRGAEQAADSGGGRKPRKRRERQSKESVPDEE